MIEFDVEATGLQPWSQAQYAFLYIFFDGDAAARVEAYNEAKAALETIEDDGIEGSETDELCAVVNDFDEDDLSWCEPVAFRVGPPEGFIKPPRFEFAEQDVMPDGTLFNDSKARLQIQKWFDRAIADEEGIRCWNTKFDWAYATVARSFRIPGEGKWHDGMLMAQAVDERRSIALKAVSEQLFGSDARDPEKEVKAWLTAERARRKKEAKEAGEELIEPTYADVPMRLMLPYGLQDVLLTRKVSDRYQPVLDENEDLTQVVAFERDVLDALFYTEKRGLPASENDYRKLEQEVVANLDRLEEAVYELVPEGVEDFNPKSSPKVIEAIKARGADMRFMEREDGKIKSADADNLRAVDDELALAILKFRSEYKVLSTYVRPMIGRTYRTSMRMWREPNLAPDGRIHANYRQVGGQRTGRMSCSDPNIQNQPRDDLRLRYCIRAEPGHKLVIVDLKNIEMVLFAAYAGNGRLLEAVRRGDDLHMLTARMLGLKDRMRADGNMESARQLGKTYNFSRVYGGGLRTIRKSFRCNLDEARRLKNRFDEAYPEVRTLSARIESRLYSQGYISDKLISGRRWRVAPRDSYKATNYLVQGTAAALFKKALIGMHQEGLPVVALVHDEVLVHVPEAQAAETEERVKFHLTNHPTLTGTVPLAADGDICDHWSDAKPLKDGSLFVPSWVKEAA